MKLTRPLAYVMTVMLAVAFLVFSVACAQLGTPPPQTFKERLAVGYVTVSGVRDAATGLLNASKISVKDAQNVQAQADTARTALDIAGATFTTNPTAANDKLATTITLLGALQSYLTSQGAPK